MNVKDLFAPKEEVPELYWSLVLEDGYAQAGVWHIDSDEAKLLANSSPCPWEAESEMLGATDAALSACIQKLPENYKEPEKTVFGVSSSWIESGEIKSEYLNKIKKICDELSLTPTGFVVVPEAIAHFFKCQEGTPLSAIVLGISKESVELSIFKVGELIGTTSVSRSISMFDDVVEGLTRFESASPLPSRIILYDGKGQELTEASDVLSGAGWEQIEQFSFLHTPKVEVIDSDKKVLAVSLAGANEIASVNKIVVAQDPFIGEDIKNIEVPITPPSAADMGFLIDENIPEERFPVPQTHSPVVESNIRNVPTQQNTQPQFAPKANNILHDLKSKFTIKAPKFNFSFQGGRAMGLIVGLILLFAGGFAGWWFLPKADITIYVAPKKIEQDLDITFESTDIVETSVSGDKTAATSGKKVIGDRAKGSVLIQNGTSSNINLKAGTVLYSSGNLKFLSDETASISAALSPSDPGKGTISVTAESIGAEYNLGKDEVFKVANYPKADVDARGTADFSGGSSREILAVSKEDHEKLSEELREELVEKAKEDLMSKATSDQIVIDDFIATTDEEVNFSHKIGDEADNLKLSLVVKAKTVIYDRKKLADYVREKLADKIPQGFVLRDTQIDYKFKFKGEEDDKVNYSIALTANFLPEIKNDELKKKISGKTLQVAEDFLSTIPGYVNAQISLKPFFPGRFGVIPMVAKNIQIEIASEK